MQVRRKLDNKLKKNGNLEAEYNRAASQKGISWIHWHSLTVETHVKAITQAHDQKYYLFSLYSNHMVDIECEEMV